jgi:type IV pilus assembly protein PilM
MASSAWGIDIGNRALKAVKLVRDSGRLRVEDFEVIEHEQILSQAGDNKESLFQTALAHFVQNHNTKGIPVAVSVSGQQSFARFIKLPPVESKKVPEIVRFEAIQQIPFPLDDVEWSYQLFQDKESPDIEVGIFAMKKELVNKHIGYFTSLGLNVTTVQMSPLAVYNAMYHDDQTTQTTMFMDSGAENTDLVIAEGETVWLRTLPIGGNQFTEALAKAFKLNFQKAEELKRNAATSKYAKQIFQAMRPVFADLVAEIQRSMGFYASVHRDARIGRILALGSTFQLPGLQKYLQQNLQLPVEKLDTFKALPPEDSKTAAGFSEHSITLASAYGLAVQGIGEGKITSSLLPETIRRAKMWREKTRWFATAAGIFLVGTLAAGGAWYYHDMMYESPETAAIRSRNAKTLLDAKRLVADWKSNIEQTAEADRNKLVTIKSLGDYRELIPSIVSEIMAAAPSGDMEQLKVQKREDRNLVLIDQLGTEYHIAMTPVLDTAQTDLARLARDPVSAMGQTAFVGGRGGSNAGIDEAINDTTGANAGGGGGGGVRGRGAPAPADVPAIPESEQRRGFIITVKGVTPNKNGTRFVTETFIKALKAKTEAQALAAKKSWFIGRAEVVGGG